MSSKKLFQKLKIHKLQIHKLLIHKLVMEIKKNKFKYKKNIELIV